jgi:hypothetical protein
MKSLLVSILFVSSLSTFGQQPAAEVVSVTKIWDKAKHNAFTDLTRFKNLLVCSFREAESHQGSEGQIRVLISSSGNNWVEQARVAEKGVDLRDAKLSSASEDLLVMTLSGANDNGTKTLQGRQPRVATSTSILDPSFTIRATRSARGSRATSSPSRPPSRSRGPTSTCHPRAEPTIR